MELLDKILALDDDAVMALNVFCIVFATVLANFIVSRFILHLAKKTKNTNTLWDDALVYAFRQPTRLLIWAIGITFALEVAYGSKDATIFSFVLPARDVMVIFSIAWFCLRFIKYVEDNILHSNSDHSLSIDQTTLGAIGKLLRIAITITALLVGMQTLGFSVGGVLAFGGIGGMAIGFAAKDMLSNFFGAIMIYFDRPFAVGDWIRSPDKNIEGTVEDIGWRQTRIRTFDKRPLYVPNSVFSTIAVENPSRMLNRRIYETIGIRYDDIKQMDKITNDVRKMLKTHKEIDTKQTLMVNFNEFSASSIDFFIYTFTKTTDWVRFHEIKHEILLKIAKIIEKHGAEIAYPTSTVHIPEAIELSEVEEAA